VKNSIVEATIILLILLNISCVSPKGIHFVNLTTRDLPSETELIITTTEPVQVKNTRLENPPCLILSFPEDRIYSLEQEELVVNKGLIKRIRQEMRTNRD